MKTKYLLYFCDDIGSVFDSQVLAFLSAISKKNYFEKVYLFLGIKDENQKNDVLKRKISSEIKIVYFKTFPNYPLLNYKIRDSILAVLRNQGLDLREVIFHTRGEMTAWHLSKILGKRYYSYILPDVRGVSIEEISEFNNFTLLAKYLKIHNYKKSLKNLNLYRKISVVSDALKEYLICKNYTSAETVDVTPCLAGSSYQFDESVRSKTRESIKIHPDDILIVFSSGGTAAWQNNEVVEVLARKGFKMLNLSKKEINHPNVINKFVNYNEVASYLNAADIALIWRDKSIVNKVASPVKFSEYVCCGLPVIANYSVDLINEYIKKHDCGTLVETIDEIENRSIKALRQMDRRKISDTAILRFGIESIVDKYLHIYSSFTLS